MIPNTYDLWLSLSIDNCEFFIFSNFFFDSCFISGRVRSFMLCFKVVYVMLLRRTKNVTITGVVL